MLLHMLSAQVVSIISQKGPLVSERAAYYRKMAMDALKHAETAADEESRRAYLGLAQSWHALAVQHEEKQAETGGKPGTAPPGPLSGSSRPTRDPR